MVRREPPPAPGRLLPTGALLALLVSCGPNTDDASPDARSPDASPPEGSAPAAFEEPSAADTDAASPPGEGPVTVVPPGPDILLGGLDEDLDSLVVRDLRNVTARPGYDSQPAFHPEGSALLYTVIDSAGQADIWRYDLQGGGSEPFTSTTPESEYSATPLPGTPGFSVVKVEADSTQRLWRIGPGGGGAVPLFPGLEPVGYHAWAGSGWVAAFVLGEPPRLVVASTETRRTREVATDIGRSIQSIPGTDAISFVQHLAEPDPGATPTRIMRWDPATGVSPIAEALDGGEDHAWTPEGTLLMGRGSELHAWRPDGEGWQTVATIPSGVISRIAVDRTGTRIALVVEPDARSSS